MKPWALILCAAALLSGCAGQQIARTPPPPHLFQDQLFQPAKNPVDTEHVFAVTPEMRTYRRREVNENVDKDVRRQLVDARLGAAEAADDHGMLLAGLAPYPPCAVPSQRRAGGIR